MGRQDKELVKNIEKYEENKVKQQKSKVLEQRKVKETKNQKETTIRYYR
jgi:hypothetical protein